jgi:transketolase
MKTLSLKQLEKKANEIRRDLITTLTHAGSGHSAGPLGMVDVFTALYFHILKHDPKKPRWKKRDRVYLSNGHICPVWYTTLAHAGYFPKKELRTLRQLNTRLQGHPHRGALPGIECTTGPLGQGTSVAVGAALASRINKQKHEIFCLTGDGELDEGQVWEAFMLAGKERIDNLTFIIDRNNIQIDGMTEEIMPLDSLRDKLESFNLHVIEIDGHNMEAIIDACSMAKAIYEKPVVIIAHTIPGKGVDFMEFDYTWHGKPPNAEEARVALRQLRSLGGKITSECE